MSAQAPRQAAFRKEVIEHRLSRAAKAQILQIDPEATTWGVRLLMLAVFALVMFAIFGRVNEYASGPAFIRLSGATSLTSSFDAVVTRIDAAPGEKVKAGDILVHFNSNVEVAELTAASREFDDQLSKLLQRPDDPTSKQALVALRARRELARQRVEQRILHAPHDGVVGDVRVREGQLVEAGHTVVELLNGASEATVVALLPGRYRPMLHDGDLLRFELDGFKQRAYSLRLGNVGFQIVGPQEAARYVGHDSADTLALAGPVVLVQARLPSPTFQTEGHTYNFASGMNGKAEVAVRNEPVIFTFVPALKAWVENLRHHDDGGTP